MDIGEALNVNEPVTGATPTPGFTPPPMGQPAAPQRNVGAEWNDFLNQPGNRQAFIQAGIQLLQPVGLGQSSIGQLGQAVGSGAAAKNRYLTQQEDLDVERKKIEVQNLNAQRTAGLTAATLLSNNRALGDDFQNFLQLYAKNEAAKDLTLQTDPNEVLDRILTDPDEYRRLQQLWSQSRGQGTGLPGQLGVGQGVALGSPLASPTAPPAGAVDMLRKNPSLAPQFDQKYGAGSARKILGK